MGHQVSAPLPAAVWTETLTAALNQSAAVWEMSPVGTVIEDRVVRWMCDLAGFGRAAGGTFTSGGTEATFAALLAARHARAARTPGAHGVGADPPVVRVRRARALRGRARHRRAGARHRPRRRRAVARLPHGRRGARARRSTDSGGGPAGDGRRRHRGHHGDGIVRRPRGDRPAVRGARTCGCTWTARTARSALLSPTHRGARRGHPSRALDRVGSAQDDADAAGGERGARARRARPPGRVRAARAVSVPRGAEASVRGIRGCAASSARGALDALKVWVALQRYGAAGLAALYDHLCATAHRLHDAIRERAGRSRRCTSPRRTSSASASSATDPCRTSELDALNLALRETATTAPATAGSRRPCSAAAACCA